MGIENNYVINLIDNMCKSMGNIPLLETNIKEFNIFCRDMDKGHRINLYKLLHKGIIQYNQQSFIKYKTNLLEPTILLGNTTFLNIVFRINKPSFNNIQIDEVNQIDSSDNFRDRINWIIERSDGLDFVEIENKIFENNLILIDSKLPVILASIIKTHYISGINKISELTEIITSENPCEYDIDLNPKFYEYKIKRMLVDSALGMKVAKVWSGNFNANGGYIAVKNDGEILCYHIYNFNEFQDYLFLHTKIDNPDSKKARCDFGRVLPGSEIGLDDGYFIKLNFQIRFIK